MEYYYSDSNKHKVPDDWNCLEFPVSQRHNSLTIIQPEDSKRDIGNLFPSTALVYNALAKSTEFAVNKNLYSVITTLIVLGATAQSVPVLANENEPAPFKIGQIHKDAVHEEVLIKATPQVVWESMLRQRKLDPDSQYCKSVGQPGTPLVEQKFKFPSPFGAAECILHLSETPAERVDFRLIESEELKKMEGYWVLTPVDNGQSTKLGLCSYVEPNIALPRIVTNGIISHKAKKNLAMVKKLAEKSM